MSSTDKASQFAEASSAVGASYSPEGAGLVSPSDIADIAGVSRSAVSNWRKRREDFPQPIAGSATKPLFNLEQVTSWLRSSGYAVKEISASDLLWSALNQIRGNIDAHTAELLLTTLAEARVRAGTPDLSSVDVSAEDAKVVQSAFAAINVLDVAAATDDALEKLARAQGRSVSDHGFVGSAVSSWLAAFAADAPGGTLYDPACGIGVTLLKTLELAENPESFTHVVGTDISSDAISIATARAALRDLNSTVVSFHPADVLAPDRDPAFRADTIVVEPPFGLRFDPSSLLTDSRFEFGIPNRSSADMIWIQHAISKLSDKGRAFVVTPLSSAINQRDSQIREQLLRRGCIECIVSLPEKVLPNVSAQLVLWVLNRPTGTDSGSTVTLFDCTDCSPGSWKSPYWPPRGAEEIVVPVDHLIASSSALDPKRWSSNKFRSAKRLVEDYLQAESALFRAVDETAKVHKIPDLDLSDGGGADPLVILSDIDPAVDGIQTREFTVRQLVEQGIIEVKSGNASAELVEAETNSEVAVGTEEPARTVVAVADVRDGRLFPVRSVRNSTDDPPQLNHSTLNALAYDVENTHVTVKDDVLVAPFPPASAVVDPTGNRVPATGVVVVRVLKPDVLDAHFLAGMLGGGWNESRLVGRLNIDDFQIALADLATQRATAHLLRAFADLRSSARTIVDSTKQLEAALMETFLAPVALFLPD